MKEKKVNALAKSLKTAGEESRLKMLCMLFNHKDMCVSDMAEKLKMSVAIASHHLNELAKVGLVSSKRDGKMTCYSLAKSEVAKDLKRFICKYK